MRVNKRKAITCLSLIVALLATGLLFAFYGASEAAYADASEKQERKSQIVLYESGKELKILLPNNAAYAEQNAARNK